MIVECRDNIGVEQQLIRGKCYRVESNDKRFYRIKNELGYVGGYTTNRFNVIIGEHTELKKPVPIVIPTKVSENSDLIDKQEHYTNNGIQPIEIMRKNMSKDEYRGFLMGNIIKYPMRYKDKNGIEDLKKAKTYLTWLINDIEERGL